MEFKFDLKAKRVRIPTAEILESLGAFARRRRLRPFTQKQWNAWAQRRCNSHIVIRRFGSWRAALGMVGVKHGRGWNYQAEELVRLLEDAWREAGHPPGARMLRVKAGISPAPFVRQWGSLRRAYERLAAYHDGTITREDLLRPVREQKWKHRGIGRSVRWAVLERDGHRCVSCGADPRTNKFVELEVDHIVPVCRGGTDKESNLRTLCRPCNRGKRGRMDGEAASCSHASRARGRLKRSSSSALKPHTPHGNRLVVTNT